MKKSKHSEERIIGYLKQVEAGIPLKDMCRKVGISEATFYNWRAKFGGMKTPAPIRLFMRRRLLRGHPPCNFPSADTSTPSCGRHKRCRPAPRSPNIYSVQGPAPVNAVHDVWRCRCCRGWRLRLRGASTIRASSHCRLSKSTGPTPRQMRPPIPH